MRPTPQEKELLNVVAEMAIASGSAVPQVYLLPDLSINAFAAGLDPNDAVIGVTRGCIDQLTREELQGVIGHEFSHIVNGDMRLNIRLIGFVHGLLFMHIMGREILFRGPRMISRDKKGMAPIAATAAAMLVVGAIGWVFGQLIKSAVSRQREFLADAAAVQFTRDPDGLANALRRIATGSAHSPIAAPQAASASHLFFNEISAFSSYMTPFATHPPLAERIRRLGGRRISSPVAAQPAQAPPQKSSLSSPLAAGASAGFAGLTGDLASHTSSANVAHLPIPSPELSPSSVVSNIGTVTPAHLAQAHSLLVGLPEKVQVAARSQPGAVAIVYGLLLDTDADINAQQKLIVAESSATVAKLLREIEPLLQQVDVRSHLPLLELCIPALRTLEPSIAAEFFERIKALVRADGRLSISEYALQTILQYRLLPHFRPEPAAAATITQLSEIWPECQQLIATLAKAGHDQATDVEYAFRNGLSSLPKKARPPLPTALPACSLPALSVAIKRLRLAAPKLKQSITSACAYTVLTDNLVTDQEAELLRAVVIALGCPLPPFLEATSKATHARNPHRQAA